MKRIVCVLLILVLFFNFAACNSDQANAEDLSKNEITLTEHNIEDYLNFDGEFIDGKYSRGPFLNLAEATLDFQVYPAAYGTFKNLEITLVVTSTDSTFTYMNSFGNYWHLSEAEEDAEREIKISFRVGVDGSFSKKYSVECLNNTGVLKGSAQFKIVSVSGAFVPQ